MVVLGFPDQGVRCMALECMRVPVSTAWVTPEAPHLAWPVLSIEDRRDPPPGEVSSGHGEASLGEKV